MAPVVTDGAAIDSATGATTGEVTGVSNKPTGAVTGAATGGVATGVSNKPVGAVTGATTGGVTKAFVYGLPIAGNDTVVLDTALVLNAADKFYGYSDSASAVNVIVVGWDKEI